MVHINNTSLVRHAMVILKGFLSSFQEGIPTHIKCLFMQKVYMDEDLESPIRNNHLLAQERKLNFEHLSPASMYFHAL
jgi:hypothetical protein